MKRILVITPFFYPHIGGSQQYMLDLYVFIKKKYSDVSVDVLCYNTDNAKRVENYKGINIYRIPCWNTLPGLFCLANPFLLLEFLYTHRKSYDLIHCSTRFFDSSWWAPLYAKLIGRKIIITDHCAGHPMHKNTVIRFIAKLIDLTIVRLSLSLFDIVFAQNKKTKNFLKQAFGINSYLAYPGMNNNSLRTIRLSSKNSRVKVVYVGRMIESKGVQILFDIAGETPKVDFIFAGPGPLANSFKKKVKRFKMTNILVKGALSKPEVIKLLYNSDIFAYPSWHSEGMPMALLEAAASKIAVVATDSGGAGEIIINNKTGLMVRSKDKKVFKKALYRLINSNTLRKRLGDSLYRYSSEKFSWGKTAEAVIKYLQ
ncbi:MAG: glycosyltransferase family 4 protein [Patescibacteria group bacterium]|nr:glycosyltransferase family 4 protein [Actinomycetota bacterium]MCL5438536.1 glycosyltransferase family 4 protein [Patescibacteria group bacterium]